MFGDLYYLDFLEATVKVRIVQVSDRDSADNMISNALVKHFTSPLCSEGRCHL